MTFNEHFDFFRPCKNEHVLCTGVSQQNVMAYMYDPDSNQVYVTVYLQSPKSFWRRLQFAIGYVTKFYRPRGGDYSHFLVEKEEIPNLRAFLRKVEEA